MLHILFVHFLPNQSTLHLLKYSGMNNLKSGCTQAVGFMNSIHMLMRMYARRAEPVEDRENIGMMCASSSSCVHRHKEAMQLIPLI